MVEIDEAGEGEFNLEEEEQERGGEEGRRRKESKENEEGGRKRSNSELMNIKMNKNKTS
jgi:hypothetical protein